jgi:glucuronoarabinoxylan endo-1,4-beta-xylanase
VLSPDGGAFRPASTFQAQEASFNVKIAGARMLMLPFEATIPEGITAYAIADDLALTAVSTIAAHTPVLVMGSGEYSFMGTGEVSFAKSAVTKKVRGTYTAIQLYAGDYVLGTKDNKWGFSQLTDPAVLSPFDVYVSSLSAEAFLPLPETVMGIQTVSTGKTADSMVYDIQGRRVVQPTKGLYISNGKKRLSVSR